GAMRLATIRTEGGTTAAWLDGDVLVPLDAADVGEVLAAGGLGRPREGAAPVPAAEADFAPVVPRPGKIICVGLNYRAHILETGRDLPEEPPPFAKFAGTLRPGDLIATGTPGGVGNARKPPVYLQPGNVLRTWIEGLGECVNQCVAGKTG